MARRRGCKIMWMTYGGKPLSTKRVRKRFPRDFYNAMRKMACERGEIAFTLPGAGITPGNVFVAMRKGPQI